MFEEVLNNLGLSTNEAKVYEAMLHTGEASVQEISLKSKVHRRNVYDAIAKLTEKGLASEGFERGEKKFRPMHPKQLLAFVEEKQERLNNYLPEMESIYLSIDEKEEAYMHKGIEGFKNYLQNILDTGETVHFIGAKAFWLDPRLKHFVARFERERKKKGIKFKHLFDHEVKESQSRILKFVGKPYKFLPKEYSGPAAIDIFGPYVVTFVGVEPGKLGSDPIQFVLKSQRLADGYRKFFQFMWDNCK